MKQLIFTIIIVSSLPSFSQVGDEFPFMETESLSNNFINIPEDTNCIYSLIGLAFSKKSESYLNSWFQPTYVQFIYEPETPSLFAGNYDINCYFVPMFTGAKRPAYKTAMQKVASSIDPKLYPHVLFYKGSLKEYKKALNFDGKDLPYFYVLDPEGNIVYTTSGRYTQSKMQEIINAVEDSWK
jgi:hypothetical protein